MPCHSSVCIRVHPWLNTFLNYMIKHFVTEIGGIEGYGIISLCLFIAVFTAALVWTLRLKKDYLKTMSALPLLDGETARTEKGVSHE
jgi:cytochrome c oxidase cbb3-type subunit IV